MLIPYNFISYIINIPIIISVLFLFITGFTGKDCDKAVVPCDENPCENGAVCLLEDDRSVCYCVPDYHGALCELKYDDCESKFARCENGGTCVDGVNSFTCSCPSGYAGSMCEHSFPTTTTATEINSFEETSSIKTTISITAPKTSTLATDTSIFSTSSTSSFVTYSTFPKTSGLPYTKTSAVAEKTTTSEYQDSNHDIFLTEIPLTSLTTDKEEIPIQNDLLTSEPITISIAPTEGYSLITETSTESTKIYLPTGKSIHGDGDISKPGSYDRTTKTYSSVPDIVDEDVTHITEYTILSRYIKRYLTFI
jgi:EYS protein